MLRSLLNSDLLIPVLLVCHAVWMFVVINDIHEAHRLQLEQMRDHQRWQLERMQMENEMIRRLLLGKV